MSFFKTLFDNPVFMIFTLVSLATAANAVRLAVFIRNHWAELRAEPLLPWKMQIMERAAFLLAVPPGVIVHEFGHVLATWLFGGRIVDVGFGFYWGYVVPAGNFTAGQDWFISLAGTIGTLLYGLALWLLFRHSQSTSLRYFGLRALRFHLYYGLIYYPVFTLLTIIGDWRTIYNFQATPLLSGLVLVVHAISLSLFWWFDRHGRFEIGNGGVVNLANPEEVLQKIDDLRRSGAIKQAQSQLRAFLRRYPDSAVGHLQMAALESDGRLPIPAGAIRQAQKALSLGLAKPNHIAFANSLLAQYEMEIGHFERSVHYLDEAITLVDRSDRPDMLAHLYYLRAWAYRRWGKYELAFPDIEQAIQIGSSPGREVPPLYKQEQKIIQQHSSGR